MQVGITSIVIAVFALYILDFSINAGKFAYSVSVCDADARLIHGIVQGSCRTLIVDTLPASQQQLGNAWGDFPRFNM